MKIAMFMLVLLFLTSVISYAQPTTATVEGYVRDMQGRGVPDVTVIVRNPHTGLSRTTSTSADGYFNVPGLPPATYEVIAQHLGYQTQVKRGVHLLLGQLVSLSFALEAREIQMEKVEVISEQAPTFELKRADVSMPVRSEQIMDLPLDSRNILTLAQIAPGIRSYAPIGGQVLPSAGAISAYNFINLYVDGMEWKSLFNGNIVGLGQTASPLSQDAVQEFRVLINAYDPEYTRGGAFLISAVTRRGTNDLRGTAFITYEAKALTARGAFQTVKPDYNRQQAGLSLSGPIIPDKLFYSATYELFNAANFIDVVPGRPSYNPNIWSQYAGTFKSPRVTHLGTVRLTYQPDAKNTLDLIWNTRYTWSKFYFGGIVAYQAGLYGQYHVNNLMLKHTYVIGSQAMNELSLQYLRWRHDEPTLSSGPSYHYPGVWLGRGNFPIALSEDHYTIQDRLSYTLANFYGSHVFKVGFEISNIKGNPWFPYYKDGEFYFTTDTSSLPYAANIGIGYYTNTTEDARGKTNGYVLGGFVQDRWVASDRLTLSLGLRWDGEINTLNNDFAVPWASDTAITNHIPENYINRGNRKNPLDNFGPRLSFNYDLFGNGLSILRGGYGVFYDRTPQYLGYFEWEDASWRIYNIQNPGTLDPAQLRAMVQSGKGTSTPSLDLLDRNMHLPKITQWSIGVGQQVSDHLAVSVDYVNNHVSNLYKGYNVNYYVPSAKRRALTNSYGNIWLYGSFGRAYYYGVLTNLTYRHDNVLPNVNVFAQLSYTLSWAYSDADGNTYTLASLFYRQRSNLDERHRIVLNWRIDLPFDFQFSGIVTLASPTPFGVYIGQDLNNDNDYGDDWPNGQRYMVPSANLIRNWYKNLDIRVTKYLTMGRVKLGVIFEAYNVGNWFNASGYFGRMFDANGNPYASFGQPVGAYQPRTMQLGARVYL